VGGIEFTALRQALDLLQDAGMIGRRRCLHHHVRRLRQAAGRLG
jgi:hypothetical protein